MPELRKDPIIGRWVIIATERAKRPHDFAPSHDQPSQGECPFCAGHESLTPPEIFAIRSTPGAANRPDWQVRVVPSIAPVLRIEGDLNRRGRGLYDLMNGIGAHEVVVETPAHITNVADLDAAQIAAVLNTYQLRITDLEKDQRFRYVLLFKNHGRIAGSGRMHHSRSQLIATPVTPKRVKEELLTAKQYFEYKERCVFCDVLKQELQDGSRVVVDAPTMVAIAPFASRFPFELTILPKRHACDFASITPEERQDLAHVLKQVLGKLKQVLADPPYNYLLHTAPFHRARGKASYWKTIDDDYHWHFEIMPRLTKMAGFEWGSGFYINPTPPEEAATYLRETTVAAPAAAKP